MDTIFRAIRIQNRIQWGRGQGFGVTSVGLSIALCKRQRHAGEGLCRASGGAGYDFGDLLIAMLRIGEEDRLP
jgi:hypothetical protein